MSGTGTRRRTPRRTPVVAAVVLALLAPASGCAPGAGGDGEVLTVLAAASLAETFEQLADRFESEHPGVEVRLATGGSADLVAQVEQGAPADVVATADEPSMQRLAEAGLVAEPAVFATNVLQLAVPPGNPAGIASLAGLDGDLAVVVCAPQVPCGAAAARVAEAAGVALRPVSEEQSVTDVLGKVRSGEADAGLVYVTDVLAADGAVDGVVVPEAAEAVNRYPVAAVRDAGAGDLARDFVDLVLSPQGRAVLAAAGFGGP